MGMDWLNRLLIIMLPGRWPDDRQSGEHRYRNSMILRHLTLLLLLLAANPLRVAAQVTGDERPVAPYYPDATWQHKNPLEAGINPKLLKEAVDLAIAGETKAPHDLVLSHYETFGREPFRTSLDPSRTGAIRAG
jgi:hypothetical protein